jgi:L-ascorbate metabolism protein UlaG (beta-lactamase superfamily)
VAGAAAAAGVAALVAWAVRDIPGQMGAQREVTRGERVRSSPRFRDGVFHNSDPGAVAAISPREAASLMREAARDRYRRRPSAPVPLAIPEMGTAAADALRLTWYGHASALVEIDGARLLLDPVWSERCSPSRLAGPRRMHPNPVPLSEVPPVDAVLISHDHYDHLDAPTIKALTARSSAPFVVPLGVAAHLRGWGVPDSRIVELDWDEQHEVAGIRLTATAAQHFSGRAFTRNNTLWASWVLAGPHHRVYYTGDSGYFDGYTRIGAEHGPFDATLVQVGAYGVAWPHIHMFPEEAVQAHLDLRGELLIPVHWCTFDLALHDWSDPVERLLKEAQARDVRLVVPRPGETIDAAAPPELTPWWRAVA